jgi:hypothetical protein
VRAVLPSGAVPPGSLCRSRVSILVAEGASIVELAAVMGWSHSTAVAMSMRYGHLFAPETNI